MNSKKRIISLVLAIVMMLGSVLSLSSCIYALELFVDGFEDGYGDGDSDTDGESGNDQGQNPGGNDAPSTPSGDGSESSGGSSYYPGSGESDIENVAALNRTLLSTVVITSHFGSSVAAGSGVIYKLDKESGDAYILTNYHVVYSSGYGVCDSASLYLYGMQLSTYAITATVLGGSVNYDIAVLKVEGSEVLKNSYAVAANLGNSEDVRVFDKVAVVGNPEAYGMAATMGIVSVDSESLEMTGADGSAVELRVMRIDAAVNEGNSGGGLYDMNGDLIGVVVAKRIGSDIDNMAYAIPVNLAKNLAENIIANCDGAANMCVKRVLLGITITAKVMGVTVDSETGDMKKAEVVEITELTNTCIAKDKLAVGDVVNSITVDGTTVTVTRMHHIIDLMLTAKVGSTVTMNITRGESTFNVTVTVPASAVTDVK